LQFVFQSEKGTTLDSISADKPGFVLVGGEYWKAKTVQGDEIKKGEKVKVVGKEADMLVVEALPTEEEEEEQEDDKD
jgi:membrane-bound serine protease (ClpP class)